MIPMLVVAVASLVAVGLINSRLATSQTKARIEQQLQGVMKVLANRNFPLTDSVLEQMGELAHASFVLVSPDGEILASNSAKLTKDVLTQPQFQSIEPSKTISLGPSMEIGSERYFHSSMKINPRQQTGQLAVLHILFPHREYNAAWRTAFFPPFIVGVATLLLVAVVTHVIAARLSNVFGRMSGEVQRFAKGNYSAVDVPQWDDEARDLAIAINRTADQLAEYETEVRKNEQMRTVAVLGAGIAHEIRNAATGCRMAVDLHAEACEQMRDEDDTLSVARRQLTLMENRIQRFLQFGKSPEDTCNEDLDFVELLHELIALVEPTAQHAGVEIQWQVPNDPVLIHANTELLSQAIMNLLLNALDAAKSESVAKPDSSLIRIALETNENELEMIVADSGKGPDNKVAGQLFEPFVSDKSEGTGLGLVVAKRVIESYGGSISWSRIAELTQFKIQMPLAKTGAVNV